MTSEEFRSNPLFLRNQFKSDGSFDMPIIQKQNIDLTNVKLIGYDQTKQGDTINSNSFVHFFLDDYKFEVIWKDPEPRLEKLSQYKGILSPQFSTYYTMPITIQIYNTFRSRWCGAYLQSKGFNVIPTISWGLPKSYLYCFDGVEEGSIVAVSTLGVKKEKDFFMQGYNEMLSRINPKAIICYCEPFDEMQGNIIAIDYAETNNLTQRKIFYGCVDNSCYEKKTEQLEMPQSTKSYYVLKRCGYVVTAGMGSGGIGSGSSSSGWKPKKEDDERFLGKPNSIKRTHKDTNKGGYDIDTKIGPDGKATKERHYTDHGFPKKHSSPHDHEIDWSKGYPNPDRPINYPDGAPEFKDFRGGFIMSKKLSQEERFEENRFKSIDDFKFAMECNSEVEFEWKSKIYGIAHPNGTISVYEYYKPETEFVCRTADEALEYIIDGQNLREIITKVKIWDRTI